MTLDFATDEPMVGLRRQQELIKAVLRANEGDESQWLEWKSTLDVSKAAGAFAVARAILGFANRMPDVAERWAGGHAYLLVGVEEGALAGVPRHDVEKLDPWITRYTGNFDRFQLAYVPFDNGQGQRDVLLVDVSPPRWGDPLYPLRKEHTPSYAGTVFHRYRGRTQPARAAEIDALSERARRATQRIDVEVTAAAGVVAVVPAPEEMRARLLNVQRERLLSQLEPPAPEPPPGLGLQAMRAFQVSQVLRQYHRDQRSEEQFRDEVEDYLRDLDATMQRQFTQTITHLGTPLQLKLTNLGETFLAKVEVVLNLPGIVQACLEDDDVTWPREPREYGTVTVFLPGLQPSFPAARLQSLLPTTGIEQHEDRTIIRFLPVGLRAHETVLLDPVTLYSHEDPPEPLSGTWRATATNISGEVRRELPIPHEHLNLDVKKALFGPDVAESPE